MVEKHLLTPIPYEGFNLPLMAELPINPELCPVLVTSTQGVLWVKDKDGLVRCAFRGTLDDFFKEVLSAALEEGLERGWQNSGSFSEEGLKEALDFLRYYEIPEPYCLLVHDSLETGWAEGFSIDIIKSSWVPSNSATLVPKDRSYLGSLIQHKSGMFASVVHNISRGMFVLRQPHE